MKYSNWDLSPNLKGEDEQRLAEIRPNHLVLETEKFSQDPRK